MIRHLFTAASVASLLVCFGALVLWYKTDAPEVYALSRDWVDPERSEAGSWNATAVLGDLTIWRLRWTWTNRSIYEHYSYMQPRGWCWEGRNFTFTPNQGPPPIWGWVGFSFHQQRNDFDDAVQDAAGLTMPLWAVVLLAGVLPALALIRAVRRRVRLARIAAGCCVACGYDLRASADRCPECGTLISVKVR